MITENEAGTALSIERAMPADIDGLIGLLCMKHPAAWIKRISRPGLVRFLEYAINDPLCVVLMARMEGDSSAGYIFSTINTGRFWRGFAVRHPLTMLKIIAFRTEGVWRKNRQIIERSPGVEGDSEKPMFSWAPSGPGNVRIMGILVSGRHRGKGVAKKLYLSLFEKLEGMGCDLVEEYMGPDYCQFVGKYQDCGWRLQEVRGSGYKIIKELKT